MFFFFAVGISLTTYMKADHFSLLDNILNTTDLALTTIVSIAIYLFGDHTTRFSRFNKRCLVAVIIIILFWFITENHVVTHSLTQGILVIAYFPVVSRLWKTKENGESFLICFLIATCAAVRPAGNSRSSGWQITSMRKTFSCSFP